MSKRPPHPSCTRESKKKKFNTDTKDGNVDQLIARARDLSPSLVDKMKLPSVVEAQQDNQCNNQRGSVKLGRVWRGQKREHIPYEEGFIAVRVSKGMGTIGNALSPFHLEVPPDMMGWATVDGKRGSELLPQPQKLETVWQSAKKYKNETMVEFFSRRAKIYKKGEPKRRYCKKAGGVWPQIDGACFGYEGDPLVNWGQSRVFYCQAYERSVQDGESFQLLNDMVDCGFNLLLLGPDGWPVEGSDYQEAYEDVSSGRQFGHERVLACMLAGVPKPWEKAAKCWPECLLG